jgi:hypothetical protein
LKLKEIKKELVLAIRKNNIEATFYDEKDIAGHEVDNFI